MKDSIDRNVKFALFQNEDGATGIKLVGKDFGCPFCGMVAVRLTDEQAMKLNELEDVQWLDGLHDIYTPFITTVKSLKKIGIELGEWEFGFFGDVTPEEDQKVLMLTTDSNHLIWVHFMVE